MSCLNTSNMGSPRSSSLEDLGSLWVSLRFQAPRNNEASSWLGLEIFYFSFSFCCHFCVDHLSIVMR